MAYLIDTNVISEATKAKPSATALGWLASADPAECYLSALTIGELADGAAQQRRKGNAVRAERLELWLAGLEEAYADRILSVDAVVAHAWAGLGADRTLPVVDSLIAATARAHGLTVATRNVRDFQDAGVPVVNPFAA